jgi:biopolymer transport protein ExbD
MYDYNNKPELNITPLVDVMLVLLAILMLTAPVIEFEEQISLPRGSKSKQIKVSNKIDIFIKKNRTVLIDKTTYKLEDFIDSFILFTKNSNRNTPVHLRADKTLLYDDIVYILKSIKEAGFIKISLITDG